jgi:hypothetical protein
MKHDPARTPTLRYPHLTPTNHRVTSPATGIYNCLAWAAGENFRWWEPGRYWPCPLLGSVFTLADVIAALRTVGYDLCPDGIPEAGFDKVALYAEGIDDPTHVARQLHDGRWTSKLGDWEDIEHDTAGDVAGGLYGDVVQFMRRAIP